MVWEILLPVLIAAGLALAGAGILTLCSVYMAVPVDEKEKKILAALPGANCGGCGFSGCADYAAAIARGDAPGHLCNPGGAAAAEKIAAITGLAVMEQTPKTAVVTCVGNCEKTNRKMRYHGLQSCAAAATYYGGTGECAFGCIGLGDCTKACVYGAIALENGVAKVDQSRCTGCSACAKACPKGLIALVRIDAPALVMCANHDGPAASAKVCKAGCIGCGRCEKVCEQGAIAVDKGLAHIDERLCIGCGKCAAACVRKVIYLRGE